jgi:hypothetical protein
VAEDQRARTVGPIATVNPDVVAPFFVCNRLVDEHAAHGSAAADT